MRTLVTGGAGYLGSHTTLTLLLNGIDVIVLDNLCNSSTESLNRIQQITGRQAIFIHGDIRDRELLDRLFSDYQVDAVIHFAGLKAVGESVMQPLLYFDNNVHGSQVLMQAMSHARIFKLVFSSSATVYGEAGVMPITESSPTERPASPYGRSKLMVEDMIRDLARSDPRWRFAILRYFNPVGAHESGLIGESTSTVPNNLVPYIAQVATGKLEQLSVFGNDYDTPDGTGVRDYIHVMDLAEAHLCALDALKTRTGAHVWNLGTGRGYSVMQVIRAFEIASGKHVRYCIAPRRLGDIPACYADPTKAERELGWRAKHGLSEMMTDTWRWHSTNPEGYLKKTEDSL